MNQFCECKQDGWCNRYQREMKGRFRQICQGINCDLGTSAAFREQWSREIVDSFNRYNFPQEMKPLSLLLKTDQAPGDAVAMTAAIYSLHKAHPGKYVTYVESLYPEIFQYNPDVAGHFFPDETSLDYLTHLQMHYPAIHKSNSRGIHFMQGWCEFLGFALGINVPLLTNKPHLYFNTSIPQGDYWIVCSGGKNDFTNKLWGHENYQEVVIRTNIRFVQVGAFPSVNHPKLQGCRDEVGQTTLRQLFDLVRGSRGVLCGVSLLMHVAAALEKPCVVIAGGREPVQWNAYPKQHYLHTVGMLPCTSPQGDGGTEACWRSRVVPLNDGTTLDEHPCLYPVETTYARVPLFVRPECMTLIKPNTVVELLRTIDSHL